MKAITILGLFICIFMVPFGIGKNLDPLYPLLLFCLPDVVTHSFLTFTLIRGILLSSLITNAYRIIIFLILLGLIVLVSVNDVLGKMALLVLKRRHTGIHRNIAIYKQMQIYFAIIEPLYYVQVPVIILSASIIIVVCNTAVLLLYGVLSLPLYGCFCTGSLIVFLGLITILPEGTSVMDRSCKLIVSYEGNAKSKMTKKLVKSLKPFGIPCGPFFMMENSVRKWIVWWQMDYTVNAVLYF
jgi:hypothetical protein